MKKGKFIALYGINNIGKTFHAKRLTKRLHSLGKKAVYIKYPIYNQKPTGPLLNKILRKSGQKITEEELQLWFVLNRYQFEPRLKKMLAQGITVIAEDYVGTGIAWGMAKGASQAELESMNKFLVQPDAAVLLDGKRSVKAKEYGHLHEENDALAQKCQRIFRRLSKKYRWKEVQVHDDRDVTASRIWSAVSRLL